MSQQRLLATILALVVAVQATIAGALHSHSHHGSVASSEHGRVASSCSHGHHHRHDSQRPSENPTWPVDEDECSICQGLAQFSFLCVDNSELAPESLAEFAATSDSQIPCSSPIGLRRPRAPPALG
ncbi:MAG: DUF2946 family protein [Planctomycetes bacterium]|nr:DUF2946 family protein [Planctomycetota bacterium]